MNDREQRLREENARIATASANVMRALVYPTFNKVGIGIVDPDAQAHIDRVKIENDLNKADGLAEGTS